MDNETKMIIDRLMIKLNENKTDLDTLEEWVSSLHEKLFGMMRVIREMQTVIESETDTWFVEKV